MSNPLCPSLKMLDFINKIIGSTTNVLIDTHIYHKNITDGKNNLYHHEDIYLISANPKKKITLYKIKKLFKHMDKQFKAINDENEEDYVYISDFKYSQRRKMYDVILLDGCDIDHWYNSGMDTCLNVLKFTKKIIGLKNDVNFDSSIYSHLLDPEEENLDIIDDSHILFGNADKKITLDDIYDLFNDMYSQFEVVYEKNTGRSFCFEGIQIENNNPLTYRIHWGS